MNTRNLKKYNQVFKITFEVDDGDLNQDIEADKMAKWDSISHLNLITGIEDEFGIMLDPEDILEFRSYLIGKKILAKYDVII